MNLDVLHRLIDRYEEKIDKIYNTENYELFKWQAAKTWQTEWNKPEDAFPSFADRFTAARKDFDVFIDGKIMHPSMGVIKLWQEEPQTVEHLFKDVLFADDQGDVQITQQNMDRFLDEYEALRIRHYPSHFSYKQDRHSASVFLAVNNPERQFVFKSSDAHMMARYTEFGFKIGSGASFSLPNYYRLCEEIVKALREHNTLLEKHFSYFNDKLYCDESLHLLAFDIMYCCRTYNYYGGLPLPPRQVGGKTTSSGPTDEEKERKRLASIESLTKELAEADLQIEELQAQCEDLLIPLINVEIISNKYGTGVVIEQSENNIVVQYPDAIVKMTLGNVIKTFNRPIFENDDEVWNTFAQYASVRNDLEKQQKKRNSLSKELEVLESGELPG